MDCPPSPHAGRIGLFAIGLDVYWQQFPGLKERLQGHLGAVEERLTAAGAEVIAAGLMDTAAGAAEAGGLFARSDLDLMVCHVATYATASQVLPVAQRAKVPVLVLNPTFAVGHVSRREPVCFHRRLAQGLHYILS